MPDQQDGRDDDERHRSNSLGLKQVLEIAMLVWTLRLAVEVRVVLGRIEHQPARAQAGRREDQIGCQEKAGGDNETAHGDEIITILSSRQPGRQRCVFRDHAHTLAR